jgi:hypothetical protein
LAARGDDERALLAELELVYREVDAAYEGAACPRSTECCRFGITGREPMLTSVELALVERALRARGGPVSARRRALPIAGDERTCPMLEHEGRCAIYTARPLGCRTFFCDRADVPHPPARATLTAFVRRVQSLALRHRPDGDHPRRLPGTRS